MIDIVITADYEIFGNGSGDVSHCLFKPTADLLGLCDEYQAKLTLFFEIAEFWAFRRAEEEGKFGHLGYSPSGLMEIHARKAINDGHDVQLHLHPQWLHSEYGEEAWQVNIDYWRLPNVPHGLGDFDDILSLRGLLCKGKRELERMLKPLRSDYECIALRAGDHCIQPAQDVIRAMKEVGFLADSSVFKGGYIEQSPYEIDFRSAYSESSPWWVDAEDINKAILDGHGSILELPIYALKRPEIKKLTIWKVLQWFRKRNARHPPGCKGHPASPLKRGGNPKNPSDFFRSLVEPVATPWDFCSLTGHEMWSFLKTAVKKHGIRDTYFPLIMIGHPKTFVNHKEFRKFLKIVTQSSFFRNGHIRFSTITHAVRILQNDGTAKGN